MRAQAELIAFAPNGTVLHYNDTYEGYLDVDPSPRGESTVTYVAHKELPSEDCYQTRKCTEIALQRSNLTTGHTETFYRTVTPRVSSSRWHAVDRINETHFVVADIYLDRVFVLNVSNGRVEWAWRAKQEFDLSSGGAWPKDWTHVNDVEALPDGRFMVGPRNQDQVVFLDRRKGMLENWTLGADDDHSVLYEHHNPDYIPASEGGPAAASAEFGGKNGSFVASAILTVKNLIPGIVVNGLIYVLPSWVGFVELAALAGSVATALV
ncbi:aryl-sulfate sulfotransferase [Halorussus caseinilyticus]|uniref:aryl-sulfate sulfotransferase n=1 Tax=Halorussus caseinilyticus TaxID=3034025 RepID=UPI0023E79251|nr:aryl-sulfate sulfotransferase [Halorussus sp. DT72]